MWKGCHIIITPESNEGYYSYSIFMLLKPLSVFVLQKGVNKKLNKGKTSRPIFVTLQFEVKLKADALSMFCP